MRKWISFVVILLFLLSFSNGKVTKGEGLSPSNEDDNETVILPDLRVYTTENMYTERENSAVTLLTHRTDKEKTDNFEKIIEEEENNLMKSTFSNELLNGISPLKVKQGEKILLVMFVSDRSNAILLSEPDEIEVKQINSDEKVNIEVTDGMLGHKQITAPKESGNYRYSVVFHWNELQSKASYVFDAMVR